MDRTERIPASRSGHTFPWRKAAVWASLGVVGLLLAVLALSLFFSSFLIDHWLKPRWLRAFATAHPGTVLRVTKIDYHLLRNVTLCEGIFLMASNSAWSCQVQTLSVTGVPWLKILFGERRAAKVLPHSIVQANGILVDFHKTQYRLRCRRLRGSIPGSDIRAQDIDLRPASTDEEFFAAKDYRRARLHLRAPLVLVSGINSPDLLQGKAYRAESIRVEAPTLDALINPDKPINPHPPRPLMPHEAMAAIHQVVRLDTVEVTEGRVTLGERPTVGAVPAVITFDDVHLTAWSIENYGAESTPALIRGEAKFMNQGSLQGTMELPLSGPDLSLHYSVSLGAMDLRTLNPFLAVAAHTRIDSGVFQSASCDITVSGGHAHGQFEALYRDLAVTMLDRETGSESGIWNRLKSFFVDKVAMRTSNAAGKSVKSGTVDYTRKPGEKFLHFIWFGIRSGIYDLLELSSYVKTPH